MMALRRWMALAMMAASGFAALGYQIVWTRQGAVWLGHEAVAVMAVVSAFFGGLALGAFWLGRRAERSARPGLWFAGCEAAIGVWGAVLLWAMPQASEALLALTGAQPGPWRQWGVAFAGMGLLLLPATVAMGGTLPAMSRALAAGRTGASSIPSLYAANTFGALLGVLASAFWLVPQFGLARTAALCVACNLVCAALAWQGLREQAVPEPPLAPRPPLQRRRAAALLAATGLLGIGYELTAVRVLSQVTENTVYTFALLLAVYLVGTSLGAAAYQRHASASGTAGPLRDRLLMSLAAACLLGLVGLWQAGQLHAGWQQLAGPGLLPALGGEAALALAAFLLPTLAMGALFSHLCLQARDAGIGLGTSLGINTLGAALAGPLFGALLLPVFGAKVALLVIVAGYLLLVSARSWALPPAWALAAVALVLALSVPSLSHVDVPAGGRLVSQLEGAMASVSVVEDADGVTRLHINNRQQEGSSATLLADGRQALLPLLLHAQPRRALFLGLGTGATASVAARDPALQVEVVELLPEVVASSMHFRTAWAEGAPLPPLTVHVADARRHVRASAERWDLIVSDNFHPARSGSASLYTVEHFRAVRERLAPGGVFVQWLPLHQLDLPTLRSIVASFLAVHPSGQALLATLSLETPVVGLVARADGSAGLGPQATRERVRTLSTALPLAEFGLHDEWAVLGSFVAGPRALAAWSAGAGLNTDDRPVVAYLAPRITYAADSRPRDRLKALLDLWPADTPPTAGAAPGVGADDLSRIAAYAAARNRFIEVGMNVQPTADVTRMLAQVQEPLTEVLRISPDFRPAYDPLLAMASALARIDAPAARALLGDLGSLQPARPEARLLLSRLERSP